MSEARSEALIDAPATRGSAARRSRYVRLALLTIVAGLLLRRNAGVLAPTLQDILGDALWATMVFWWVSAGWPAARRRTRALGALAFAYAVEISQLYHAPWLDAMRDTTLGHLVLGSDFDWRDLVAYAGGIAVAAVLDRLALDPP